MIPSGFKDDILASSMNGKRQYNMIYNSNGTISLEDVTKYSQVGNDFSAVLLNQMIEAINNLSDVASGSWTPVVSGFNKTITSVGTWSRIGKTLLISFYCEGTSTSGQRIEIDGLDGAISSYNVTADSVIEISEEARWYAGGGHLSGNLLTANQEFTGWIYDTSYRKIYGRNRQKVNQDVDPVSSAFEIHSGIGATEYMSGTIAMQLV